MARLRDDQPALPTADDREVVFVPDVLVPSRGWFALGPGGGDALGLSERATLCLVRPLPDGPPRAQEADVARLTLPEAVRRRHELAACSESGRVWAAVLGLGLELAATGRLLPDLRRSADGQVAGTWVAALEEPETAVQLAALAAALPPSGHALAVAGERVHDPAVLVRAALDAVVDEGVRAGGAAPPSGRPRARMLPWTRRWAEALVDPADPEVGLRDEAGELVAGVSAWLSGSTAEETAAAGTVELRLDPPAVDEPEETDWRVELAVVTDAGERVEAAQVWDEDAADGLPTGLQRTLLQGLGEAARVFPPLERVLSDGAPAVALLDIDEAWALVESGAARLAGVGVAVRLPEGLHADDLALRLRLGGEPEAAEAVDGLGAGGASGATGSMASTDADEREPTPAELDATAPSLRTEGVVRGPGSREGGLLTGFRWEIALGGETLTPQEFAALVEAQAPLVRVRDRWVRLDPDRRERLGRLDAGEVPLADALALALAGSTSGDDRALGDAELREDVEVIAEGGLGDLVERIRSATERPPVPVVPDGFVGVLRPYQARGVAWLQGMGELGLGAVLADDMGLGKTIELIAYLLTLPTDRPHLVVCPTSVLGNWQRELRRFAPSLAVRRHHGASRSDDLGGVQGVVLTTYGTLRRDVGVLGDIDWRVVCLDEAQQVKNPSTAGARAVRLLGGTQTVALTGTPLENRLAELWALLDATNPGLLGSRARFTRRFVTPVEQRGDASAARRLRRLVAPFILRRTKADPDVVADLPDKIERTVVAPLTPEQAALYQAAVDRTLGSGLETATRMERRGRVLALLTELKQICNHPAQYLRERGAGAPRLPGRSGKLAVAREIVQEATSGGAQLLCFTQYVEMGHLLVQQLSHDLGTPIPFLYGATTATERDRFVAAFQGDAAALEEMGRAAPPPVLVISLRAGGTGLNLTAATHVVHYDRWWNPAVEDQATDRAHRIGQHRTVEVHKLVTAGTVEERVAEVLERKRALSDEVVGAGEAWVTELGDAELGELVALSEAAVDLDEEAA